MRTLREARGGRAARRRLSRSADADRLPRHVGASRPRCSSGSPASAHRPALVVTRPDAPQRPRAASSRRRRSPMRARALGHRASSSPSDLHDAGRARARSPPPSPRRSCVCAFGVLIKEPLLSRLRDPQRAPVAAAALARRGADRAGDHGRRRGDRRLDHAPDRGPRLRARSACRSASRSGPTTTTARSSARLRALGGELLVRALDERPPFAEQDEAGVTYAHKIEARDRALDPTRPPEEVERTVRALRPHIGARLPLPDGAFLGVVARARSTATTLAPAGGRVRADGERLLLDCNGGALELTEIQPPGGAPDGRRGLAARPPRPGADRLLARPAAARALARRAGRAARSASGAPDAEWAPLPGRAGLARRRGDAARRRCELLGGATTRAPARSPPTCSASSAMPERTLPGRAAPTRSSAHGGARGGPGGAGRRSRARSATSARRTGSRRCCACAATPTPRVREGASPTRWPAATTSACSTRWSSSRPTPSRGIRDWATFALGTLSPQDTPTLRDALAARLDDSDDRHAHRGRPRAGAARRRARARRRCSTCSARSGPHDDGGNAADTIWKRYALTQATVRLAALTGDARLKEHLPALDERLIGTAIEPRPPPRLRPRRRPVTATNVTSTTHTVVETTLVPPGGPTHSSMPPFACPSCAPNGGVRLAGVFGLTRAGVRRTLAL